MLNPRVYSIKLWVQLCDYTKVSAKFGVLDPNYFTGNALQASPGKATPFKSFFGILTALIESPLSHVARNFKKIDPGMCYANQVKV
jgi:hypothetical protein